MEASGFFSDRQFPFSTLHLAAKERSLGERRTGKEPVPDNSQKLKIILSINATEFRCGKDEHKAIMAIR